MTLTAERGRRRRPRPVRPPVGRPARTGGPLPAPGRGRLARGDRDRDRRPARTRQGLRRSDRGTRAGRPGRLTPRWTSSRASRRSRPSSARSSSSSACSTVSISATPTCSGTSFARQRPAPRDRRSSPSTIIPTRSWSGPRRRSCSTRTSGSSGSTAAGVEVTVVQHFDAALRRTPYDVFVERIRARVGLSGFLMTPDAAFGFERRGTPAALAALGERDGFDVVVVPPFTLDGREVRSSAIRERDRGRRPGDRERPARPAGDDLGGRRRPGDGGARLAFALPVALPPDGDHPALVDGRPLMLRVGGWRGLPDRCGPDRAGDGRAARLIDRVSPPPRISGAASGFLAPRAGRVLDPVGRLPGRFARLVVSLATGRTAVVPGRGLIAVVVTVVVAMIVSVVMLVSGRLLRRSSGEDALDPRQQRHQAPGSHSGSATPRSWFS